MPSRQTSRKIPSDSIPHLSESSGRIGPVKLRVSRKPTVSGHGGDCRVLVERRIPDPPGYPPHPLATAIGESLNRSSPALKYQRSSYLRAGTARNVTNRTKSMLASNSVLGGRGGYFGDEARITMHFSQRRLPCGSIIQRRAMQMGRPSEGKKL